MSLETLLRQPIHHLGYAVAEIEVAVAEWGRLGVGPFHLLPHVEYETQSHLGQPCRLDHSAAFSHLGEVGLELHQIHSAEPEPLGLAIGAGGGNGLNHVAFVLEDPAVESARLAELGFPLTFFGSAGPIEDYMHFVPALGHLVELHAESEPFAAAWAGIAAAAREWDGSRPLRELEPPASNDQRRR